MLKRHILLILSIFAAMPVVFGAGQPGLPVNSTQVSGFTINFLGSQTASTLVSALLALLVFVVIYIALSRSDTMYSGAVPVAAILAAIVFIVINSQPNLANALLNSLFLGAIVGVMIVLAVVPTRHASKFGKIIVAVAVLLGLYLLLSNFVGLQQQVSNALHFNVLTLVSILTVLAIAILIMYSIYRLAASSGGIGKMIAIIIGLLIISFLFFPGIFTAVFSILRNPITLVIIALIFVGMLWYAHIRKWNAGGYTDWYNQSIAKLNKKTRKADAEIMKNQQLSQQIQNRTNNIPGQRNLPPPPPPIPPPPIPTLAPSQDKELWKKHQELYKRLVTAVKDFTNADQAGADLMMLMQYYQDTVQSGQADLVREQQRLDFVRSHLGQNTDTLITVMSVDKELLKQYRRSTTLSDRDVKYWQGRVNDTQKGINDASNELKNAEKKLSGLSIVRQNSSQAISLSTPALNQIRAIMKLSPITVEYQTKKVAKYGFNGEYQAAKVSGG